MGEMINNKIQVPGRFLSGHVPPRRRLIVASAVILLFYLVFFSAPVKNAVVGLEHEIENEISSHLDQGYISRGKDGERFGSRVHDPVKENPQPKVLEEQFHEAHIPAGGKKAKYLSPTELMKRNLAPAHKTIPKLLHQSWSDSELPSKFKKWSDGCREQHAEWEWVLWTDEDNEQLMKTYLPWMLEAFDKLKGPIYKADLSRHAYMYLFGG
jgi:hypothetical protein